MFKLTRLLAAGAASFVIASTASAAPADIAAALADPARPAEDVGRDAARKPGELLEMMGVKAGDKVADFVIGGGYFTRILSRRGLPAETAVQLPGFVREAAAAHAVYVPEQRHPVEVAAQQQAHLVQWLSKRLGVALKPPVLEAQGFHLMGGRLLPGETGQARAQFMYEDQAGQRVTLYVSVLKPGTAATTAPASFQWSSDGASHGFYWIDGRQGYALSASLPRERLQTLANAIYQQLS